MTEESKLALVRALVRAVLPGWEIKPSGMEDLGVFHWAYEPEPRLKLVARYPSRWNPLESRDAFAELLEGFLATQSFDVVGRMVDHMAESAMKTKGRIWIAALTLSPEILCRCMARALGIEVGESDKPGPKQIPYDYSGGGL
jgi:hypothetical protein